MVFILYEEIVFRMWLLWHIEADNLQHVGKLIATAADHQPIGCQAPMAVVDRGAQLAGTYDMVCYGLVEILFY